MMRAARCILPRLLFDKVSEAAQIVEDYLTHNWAIRIEYAEVVHCHETQWEQWGNAFYAVSNAKKLHESIYACHMRNPDCALRISAERFSPEARLYFMICDSINTAASSAERNRKQIV